MDDMHNQHETPTSDAARGAGHYLTGALAATDLAVRLRTWITSRAHPGDHGLRPGDLEQAGQVLDPKREAYHAMLGRDHHRADSRTALLAWVSAQPHRDQDPQAELVAGRAEARLRDLHPDAMARYDSLRAGLSPVEAMREVVPLIVVEQQHAAARELFAPMLDNATAASADSSQALAAWTAALPLADTLPDAAAAAAAAESRLRELHPDAMGRYDSLRDTHTPTAALDEVRPLIDPALTGSDPRPADDVVQRWADLKDVDVSEATPWQDNQHELLAETLLEELQTRYAPVVRDVLQAELAHQVLHDQAWPALAGALATAEQLGAQPADLLATAAGQRELASAKSAAQVLTFRVQQHTASPADTSLGSHPAPAAAAPSAAAAVPRPEADALAQALAARLADAGAHGQTAAPTTSTLSLVDALNAHSGDDLDAYHHVVRRDPAHFDTAVAYMGGQQPWIATADGSMIDYDKASQNWTLRPSAAEPLRTPTAADLVARSYPTSLADPGAVDLHPQDLALLGAALELGREAATERQTAKATAGTTDDTSTPHVDERREGQNQAQTHTKHAGTDQGWATGLLGQAEASRAAATAAGAPATATAAVSYPTPIKEVTATQAAPKVAATAPAARATTRRAPTTGRRR